MSARQPNEAEKVCIRQAFGCAWEQFERMGFTVTLEGDPGDGGMLVVTDAKGDVWEFTATVTDAKDGA